MGVTLAMGDWVQETVDWWTKELDLPFGKVRCSARRATSILDELPPDTWLPEVAVVLATDPQFAEWCTGYIPPLPLPQAQAACAQVVQELLEYGPGEWIDFSADAPPA